MHQKEDEEGTAKSTKKVNKTLRKALVASTASIIVREPEDSHDCDACRIGFVSVIQEDGLITGQKQKKAKSKQKILSSPKGKLKGSHSRHPCLVQCRVSAKVLHTLSRLIPGPPHPKSSTILVECRPENKKGKSQVGLEKEEEKLDVVIGRKRMFIHYNTSRIGYICSSDPLLP